MAVDPGTAAVATEILRDLGGSILHRLFGIAPRGDFQKFQRTVYPLMAAQARQTQIPVHAFWFGDIVEVRPDGGFGVVASPGNIDAAFTIWNQWDASGRRFWVIRVPAGTDFNDLQTLAAVASFDGHNTGGLLDWIPGLGGGGGTPVGTPPASGPAPVLQAGVPLVIAAVLLLLLWRRS